MRKMLIAAAALALPLSCLATPAPAAAPATGLAVTKAWVRAVPDVSASSAAYVTIRNGGKTADALLSVSTPVAAEASLHRMTMGGGMMHMYRLKELPIPAGKTVAMDPGGYHIMLEQLRAPLKEGASVDLTLHFRKAGDVTVKAPVKLDE